MLANFIVIPFYISELGREAYGLVAFFSLLQVILSLADIGFSATTSRQTAMFKGGQLKANEYLLLMKIIWLFFLFVAVVGGLSLYFLADTLAKSWLQLTLIKVDEAIMAIEFIALSVGFRWMSGYYRSLLIGNERQIWLSAFNSIVATVRYFGVLPVLFWAANPMIDFFVYQVIVALLELLIIWCFTRSLLPVVSSTERLTFSLQPLESIYKFSLGVGFTGIVWVIVTQLDKLLISKLVPLDEYGGFSIAVLGAGLVLIISTPAANVLMPRLARLEAEKAYDSMITLYREATQWVSIIVFPLASMLSFLAEPVLLAWTGDTQISQLGASTLAFYALGNGILALTSFSYYLQFAKGDLKLHIIGNIIFLLILVPLLFVAVSKYGVDGAGWVWLLLNLLVLLAWVPVIHRRFLPGLHLRWLFLDILPVVATSLICSSVLSNIISTSDHTIIFFIECTLYGCCVVFAAAISSSVGRCLLHDKLFKSTVD